MKAPKLDLNEPMELLSRVLGGADEDPDLSALSAALKTESGLCDLKQPPPTVSAGVELLTRDVKSSRGIRRSPMDTCRSPFHPRIRTVPACTVGDTTEAEMKSYGLAALAPLTTTYPSAPSGGTLRRLKLHGTKRQKVPKIHGLEKHQKNHSLACEKSGCFWNTKRTLM